MGIDGRVRPRYPNDGGLGIGNMLGNEADSVPFSLLDNE